MPALTGYLVDRTEHFFWAFLVASTIMWIGALIWLFLVGPIEPVVWHPSKVIANSQGA